MPLPLKNIVLCGVATYLNACQSANTSKDADARQVPPHSQISLTPPGADRAWYFWSFSRMRENNSMDDFAFRRIECSGNGNFEFEHGAKLQITADAIAINEETIPLRRLRQRNYIVHPAGLEPGFIRTFE